MTRRERIIFFEKNLDFLFYMVYYIIRYADMAELADAHDSGSCEATRAGSSPVIRTKI